MTDKGRHWADIWSQRAVAVGMWAYMANNDSVGFDLSAMSTPQLVYSFGMYLPVIVLIYAPSMTEIKDLLGGIESIVRAVRGKS